jgi:hypothetical protein
MLQVPVLNTRVISVSKNHDGLSTTNSTQTSQVDLHQTQLAFPSPITDHPPRSQSLQQPLPQQQNQQQQTIANSSSLSMMISIPNVPMASTSPNNNTDNANHNNLNSSALTIQHSLVPSSSSPQNSPPSGPETLKSSSNSTDEKIPQDPSTYDYGNRVVIPANFPEPLLNLLHPSTLRSLALQRGSELNPRILPPLSSVLSQATSKENSPKQSYSYHEYYKAQSSNLLSQSGSKTK